MSSSICHPLHFISPKWGYAIRLCQIYIFKWIQENCSIYVMSLMIWQAKDGRIWKLKIKILLRGRYTWLLWNLELYYLGHILQIKSWLHNLCLKDCISNCKLQMYWSLAAVFIVATCFGVEWWKWAPLPPPGNPIVCLYTTPTPRPHPRNIPNQHIYPPYRPMTFWVTAELHCSLAKHLWHIDD